MNLKNQRVVSPVLIIDDIEIPPVSLTMSSVSNSKTARRRKNWLTRFFEVRMSEKAHNPDPVSDSVLTVIAVIVLAILFLLVWVATSH